MLPHEFFAKWSRANLKERAAAQEHFLGLCHGLQQRGQERVKKEGATFARYEKKVENKKTRLYTLHEDSR